MMLLLDTHALLWWFVRDERLTDSAKLHIGNAEQVYYSMVSLWEIGIKMGRSGYDFFLEPNWHELLPLRASIFNVEMKMIEPRHCRLISDLPQHHGDPFDRMLIAQALISGWAVLSKDSHFDTYGVTRLW